MITFLENLLRSKAFLVTLLVLPGLWPAVPIVQQDASVLADPGKYILHHLGFTACVVLAIVLTFTPLRVLFPSSKLAQALNRHRRLVGVTVFVYAALHLTMYLIYEGGFGTLMNDISKPFILTGIIAFTLLLALAVTSFDAAIKAMGGKRWKNLHRLVYVIAGLAAYHQIAAEKIFPMQVVWIFGPVILLEILRIRKRTAKKAEAIQA